MIKTKKIRLDKINKEINALIRKLSSEELNYVITYLVEYKEGSVQLRVIEAIKKCLAKQALAKAGG